MDWLNAVVISEPEGPNRPRVEHFLPKACEARARILHSVWEDPRYLDAPAPPVTRSPFMDLLDKLGRSDLAEQASVLTAPPADREGVDFQESDWIALADFIGVPLTNEFNMATVSDVVGGWPPRFVPPTSGDLGRRDFGRLVHAILAAMGDQSVTIAWHQLYGTFDGLCSAVRGNLAAWEELVRAGFSAREPEPDCTRSPMPTYLFPDDRSWLAWGDYDFEFTLVGGPERLVNVLELELGERRVQRVRPQTGVGIATGRDVARRARDLDEGQAADPESGRPGP